MDVVDDSRGHVVIGDDCVIHPSSTIKAENGYSVTIGSNCIIEEKCVIVAAGLSIAIGDGNLFQVGCRVHGSVIGNYNIFGTKSEVSFHSKIGSGCDIGSSVRVLPHTSVRDETAIFRTNDGMNGTRAIPGIIEVCYSTTQIPTSMKQSANVCI
jgi:dynactin-6